MSVSNDRGGFCKDLAGAGKQVSVFRFQEDILIVSELFPETRNLTPEHSACKTGLCGASRIFFGTMAEGGS
jgi:hypothetical protein